MGLLSVDEWRASIESMPVARLAAIVNTRGADAFRATFGDRFLLRRFDPALKRPLSSATVATIDLAPQEANTQSWIYLVDHSKRSAFTNFISIGRAKNNDVVLDDASISRFHAMLIEVPGGLAVYDSSRHGSFVDGLKVPKQNAGAPLALRAGVVLRCGALEMTFLDAKTLAKNLV